MLQRITGRHIKQKYLLTITQNNFVKFSITKQNKNFKSHCNRVTNKFRDKNLAGKYNITKQKQAAEVIRQKQIKHIYIFLLF